MVLATSFAKPFQSTIISAIDGTAARKRDQPGEWPAALFIKIFRPLPNLHKDLLQNVLRFLAAIQYTEEQAK